MAEKRRWTNKDFTGGLNLDISEDLLNPKYSPNLKNVRVLDSGVIGRVNGSYKLYSQSTDIKRFGYFILSNGKKYILFQDEDYAVKVIDPTTWQVGATLHTFNGYVRFAQCYNYIFFGNRINGIYRWNGDEVVMGCAPEKPVFTGLTTGNLSGGRYRYKVTYVINGVETGAGECTEVIFGAIRGVTFDIPLGPTGTTARKIYRKLSGSDNYKLIDTISDNTTTSWTDTGASGTTTLGDGTNTMVKGDFLAFWDTRLWIGGTDESATAVFFSDEGYPNRVVNDNYIDVGDVITGLIPFKDQLIVFTEKSVLAVVRDSTGSYVIMPILDKAGAYENSMTIVNGVLYWVNQDGIWAYSGSSLSLTSEGSVSRVAVEKAGFEGKGLRGIKIQVGASREWLVTDETDWNNYVAISRISTSEYPGSIILEHSVDSTALIDTEDNYDSCKGTSTGKLGQTFQVSDDIWLSQVKIHMDKIGTVGADCEVGIYEDNSGVPGDLLGSVTVDESEIPTVADDVTFDFSPLKIYLKSGTTYWIVMEQAGSDSSNQYRWAYASTDEHSGGEGYTESSGIWTALGSGKDFWFRLYKEKYVSSGTGEWEYTFDGYVIGSIKFYVSDQIPSGTEIRYFYRRSTDGGISWSGYEEILNGGTISSDNLNNGDKVRIKISMTGDGDNTPIVNSFRLMFSYDTDEGGDVIRAGNVNGEYWLSVYKASDNYYTLCRDFYGRWYKIDRYFEDFLNLGNRVSIGIDNLTSSDSVIVKLQNGDGWIDDGSSVEETISSYYETPYMDFDIPSKEKTFRRVILQIKGDGTADAFVDVFFYTELQDEPYRVLLPITDDIKGFKISLPQWLKGKRLKIRFESDYYWELHEITVDFYAHNVRYEGQWGGYERYTLDTYGDFNEYIDSSNIQVIEPGRLELEPTFDNDTSLGINVADGYKQQVAVLGNLLLYIDDGGGQWLRIRNLTTDTEEIYPFGVLKSICRITDDTYDIKSAGLINDPENKCVYIAYNVYTDSGSYYHTRIYIFRYDKNGFSFINRLWPQGYTVYTLIPVYGGFYIQTQVDSDYYRYIWSPHNGLMAFNKNMPGSNAGGETFYYKDFLLLNTSTNPYVRLYKFNKNGIKSYLSREASGNGFTTSLFGYKGEIYALVGDYYDDNNLKIYKYDGLKDEFEVIVDMNINHDFTCRGVQPLIYGDRIYFVHNDFVITFYPDLETVIETSLSTSRKLTISPVKVEDKLYWIGHIAGTASGSCPIYKFSLKFSDGYATYNLGNVRNLKRLDWEGNENVGFQISNDGGTTWSSEYTSYRNDISSITNPTNENFLLKINLYAPTSGEPSPYTDKVIIHYFKGG